MSSHCLLPAALLLATPLLVAPAFARQNPSPASPTAPAPVQAGAAPAASRPGAPLPNIHVECTPASRAAELIGKHGCVAGTVFRVTAPPNRATHLYLCPTHGKCSFQVVAFARDRAKVGDISYLRGKFVAVLGDVTESRDHPEIRVTNREQIRVAAGNPPPEFDAGQAKPASAGKSSHGGKHGRAW